METTTVILLLSHTYSFTHNGLSNLFPDATQTKIGCLHTSLLSHTMRSTTNQVSKHYATPSHECFWFIYPSVEEQDIFIGPD